MCTTHPHATRCTDIHPVARLAGLLSVLLVLSCGRGIKPMPPVSAVFARWQNGGMAAARDLRGAGFDTVILWAIHVHQNGDLFLNDERIIAGGRYVGRPGWPEELAALRGEGSSVHRIEVSVGGWDVGDFRIIPALLRRGGAAADGLRRNFQVLRGVTGADAVNLNDENHYDLEGTVAFGRMLQELGYKVTLCPFTQEAFWGALTERLGPAVDRVYLICYDGGRLNTPGSWSRRLGLPAVAGLKSQDLPPEAVEAQLRRWHQEDALGGGFLWLLEDMLAVSPGRPAAYASAVNRAMGRGGPGASEPPGQGRRY